MRRILCRSEDRIIRLASGHLKKPTNLSDEAVSKPSNPQFFDAGQPFTRFARTHLQSACKAPDVVILPHSGGFDGCLCKTRLPQPKRVLMKDFFISYNQADRGWAEWIAWQLEAAGYAVVIQAWDFRQGGNFVLDMQRALESAQRTIIVLSPNFLRSKFTAPEWAAAFAMDPTGAQGRLLPMRVRKCEPTGLLAQIVYVDLVGLQDRDAAVERLLTGVAAARAKPVLEPGMPVPEAGQFAGPTLTTTQAEPPWPPSIEVAARVAGSVFWRVVRIGVVAIGVALAVFSFLSGSLPSWVDNQPTMLYSASLLWGILTALLVEALLRLWQRRRHGASTMEGSKP